MNRIKRGDFIKRVAPHINALHFLQLCVALCAFLISLLCVLFLKRFEILMYVIVGVSCSLAFIGDFILLPVWFLKTSYSINEKMISKKSGLFFNTTQFMKAQSVQYVSVIKTPFSKITSLNFIIVHALGGVLVLQFLSKDETDELEKLLRDFARKNN